MQRRPAAPRADGSTSTSPPTGCRRGAGANARGDSAAAECRGAPGGDSQAPAGCNLYLLARGADRVHRPARRQQAKSGSDACRLRDADGNSRAGPKPALSGGVSADGQTLLFRSQRSLGPYDSEGRRSCTATGGGRGATCVSCNPSGERRWGRRRGDRRPRAASAWTRPR